MSHVIAYVIKCQMLILSAYVIITSSIVDLITQNHLKPKPPPESPTHTLNMSKRSTIDPIDTSKRPKNEASLHVEDELHSSYNLEDLNTLSPLTPVSADLDGMMDSLTLSTGL